MILWFPQVLRIRIISRKILLICKLTEKFKASSLLSLVLLSSCYGSLIVVLYTMAQTPVPLGIVIPIWFFQFCFLMQLWQSRFLQINLSNLDSVELKYSPYNSDFLFSLSFYDYVANENQPLEDDLWLLWSQATYLPSFVVLHYIIIKTTENIDRQFTNKFS